MAARDAHEIAHRDVHVDHMHAPFGGEVAGDIVDARVLGVAVHGERLYEAELHRQRGEVVLAGIASDVAAAEACFLRALDVAREQEAKTLELRAASSLARLWQRGGRAGDARRLLANATGWFTEGVETSDLRAAHQLLQQLP